MCVRLGSACGQASNILVCRGTGSVKLSDLGVAAKLDRRFSAVEPEKFAELTRRNTFIGSPAYMAPEVICVDKGCAARSHAVCLLACRLLALISLRWS